MFVHTVTTSIPLLIMQLMICITQLMTISLWMLEIITTQLWPIPTMMLLILTTLWMTHSCQVNLTLSKASTLMALGRHLRSSRTKILDHFSLLFMWTKKPMTPTYQVQSTYTTMNLS